MNDRIADIWGSRTPFEAGGEWPSRTDQTLAAGLAGDDVDRWVQSACVLCSNGCACDIAVKDGQMVGVRGRTEDRVNRGRLGPKGLFGSWQGMRGEDRLTRPLIRQEGELVPTDWDTAMDRIVERSRRLLDDVGPLSHGFYTSGQLLLEEYFALATIGKAGIGTPHMDGNTRLCTATSAAAMKESFGSDGQPGSYEDIDHCEAMFLFGHNMAETQTVLWARVLDRLAGPEPPQIVCVDPRDTEVAAHAAVHLPIRPGTNLALMHGLVRELFEHGWIDEDYIEAHTVGVRELRETVDPWTPEEVSATCGVPAEDVREAARIFGTSDRVLSTVLQGFYQSSQATAASCQVNTMHLLRGLLGTPGSGILQMNGQPTAQNTRETGADGDLPGFRNWENPDHIAELARIWDVDQAVIPDWSPPTHAMQIFRYVEQGSISFLWVSGTNPAVSMPEAARIRQILDREGLFLVVQDLYPTETTAFADVVLPAAGWGEKQGTFTNVDRTVHLAEQAVEPPGQARSDLDIFLDYARRMDFRTRRDAPLLDWRCPEDGFDAWRECSRGRLCDYTGITYERLRGGSGIQWPCPERAAEEPGEPQEDHPGTARLYADGRFPTAVEECETFGHDLLTGATVGPTAYRSIAVPGRAFLKTAVCTAAPEVPDETRPFRFTTGRTVYHFHTRTKTGRTPQLDRAAPSAWAEISAGDAARLGASEGDLLRIASRRGVIEVPARVGEVVDGTVFVPFHYGYWDESASGPGADDDGPGPRAANELTLTEWDPVSKQPVFKNAAVRLTKIADGTGPETAPASTASGSAVPASSASQHVSRDGVPSPGGGAAAEASEEFTDPVAEEHR